MFDAGAGEIGEGFEGLPSSLHTGDGDLQAQQGMARRGTLFVDGSNQALIEECLFQSQRGVGKAALYGVYDIQRNAGFMAVGVSHETAEFAVATLRHWVLEIGCVYYPGCTHLLIQADAGGANAYDSWLWKVEVQKLADEFQLAITVTHYPTGASKWNLIEHRMFSVISQNWAGEPLVSYETVLKFIRTSETETGFYCLAYFDRKHYQTKRKVTPEEKANVNLQPHKLFPEWNYTIRPNSN